MPWGPCCRAFGRGTISPYRPHIQTQRVTSPSQHVPVLVQQTLEALSPRAGQTFVDGTLGGGGHAQLVAEQVGPHGCLIALDQDPAAIERAESALAGLPVILAHEDFAQLPRLLRELRIERVDGILLDLGMSSDQLADDDRGFSFHSTGDLDLRFDPSRGEPAWRLLKRLSAKHLADLIFRYGEERFSRRIARRIVEQRRRQPIRSSQQLAELVRRCVPRPPGRQRIDAATRTFQALRIAVNDELNSLETALRDLPDCLHDGGKLAVISFHSLEEDRLVKSAFRQDGRYEIITPKPVRPCAAELERNVRSRSARLRVACRTGR